MTETAPASSHLLELGKAALAASEWVHARDAFSAVAPPTAESSEGLGTAAYNLMDGRLSFEAFERAYQLHRDRGDVRGAARAAFSLANLSIEFRGEPAVANGWLRRAERLLEGHEPVVEHAWLAIWSGYHALMIDNDIARARELEERGLALARTLGDTDSETLAGSLIGLALVSLGRVEEGMALLDEAATASLAGDVSDPNVAFSSVCNVIEACGKVHDFNRAAQWCRRTAEYTGQRNVSGWYAVCRPNYARVLLWRGEWEAAEAELLQASAAIADRFPPLIVESLVRLGELRTRQGRFAEAAELFDRAGSDPLALPGRAALALELGQVTEARDLVDRFLRTRQPEDRSACVLVCETLVRAALADGDASLAVGAVERAEQAAVSIRTAPVRALALHLRGLVGEVEDARPLLEDALDLYARAGAIAETARVRLDLATVLRQLGRESQAATQAGLALEAFRRLGAIPDARRAETFLGAEPLAPAGASDGVGLTSREREILDLMARGHSNQQIADGLVVSIRTVERHISNIYQKLGVSGAAARAAAVAYALRQEFGDS